MEDDGLSSADEESGDEMDEGTTPASATSTGSTPLSSTPGSRKNTQPPPILAPAPSQSLKPPTTSPGFLPKVLSPGPRSATAGKEYFEGGQSSESSRPASRTGKKRPSFKKEFDSNYQISSNNDIVGIVMLEIQGAEDLPKLKNSKPGSIVTSGPHAHRIFHFSDSNRLGHGSLLRGFVRQESVPYSCHPTLARPSLE